MPITENNHIVEERHYIHWQPKQLEKTKRGCTVDFHSEGAQLWFNKKPYSCVTKRTGYRTFDLYWPTNERYMGDFKIVNKSNGIKPFPAKGDLFAEYIIVNDSLIKVEYKFPEWTSNINVIAKDSMFPKYLYFFESK
jgi:hypothetical protein